MDDFQLTAKQIAALRALHRIQRDKRLADRIKAIVHLGNGWSVKEVADALLIDEKTVSLWLEKYQRGGKEELLAMYSQGKSSSLTDKQQEELAKHLDENTYLTSREIRLYIKKKT